MTNTMITCIFCGHAMQSEEIEENMNGMFVCPRHSSQELQQGGVIGNPGVPEELFAPVESLSHIVKGRTISRVWIRKHMYALALKLANGDILVAFPHRHRTTFLQYFPVRRVIKKALEDLTDLSLLDLQLQDLALKALMAAVKSGLQMESIEFGKDSQGHLYKDIVSIHFEGDQYLDIESVGSSFYSADFATQLAFSWRNNKMSLE